MHVDRKQQSANPLLRIDQWIAFSCTEQVVSLFKGDGLLYQFTSSVRLNGFLIFPNDDGAFISLSGSGVVINGQHSWLLLQAREKLMQKRLYLLELFWGCFACSDSDKHACPPIELWVV